MAPIPLSLLLYIFSVILFFRVFVIMLFVGYQISKFICQPFAASIKEASTGNPLTPGMLSASLRIFELVDG